jgi:hypothetical protein
MEQRRDDYGYEQDDDQGLVELQEEDHERTRRLLSGQNVSAKPFLSMRDFKGVEAPSCVDTE